MKRTALLIVALALAGCGRTTPTPAPTPTPTPTPTPVATPVTILITFDPANETPAATDIYCSEDFRAWLKTTGHTLRLVSTTAVDETGKQPHDLAPYLAAAEGKPAPWLVIGRAGKLLYDSPLPADATRIQDLATHYAAAAAAADPGLFYDGRTYRVLGCKPPRPGAAQRWPTYGSKPTEPILPRTTWQPVDLRHLASPPIDQAQTSSCCPCAATQALRTELARTGLPADPLSVADLYARINGGRDNGANLEDALQELQAKGVCDTEHATLFGTTERDCKHRGEWELDRARHRLTDAQLCTSADAIGSALQRHRPVVFGTLLTDTFQPDAKGVIGKRTGRGRGGHAMFLIGLQQMGGDWYFLAQNSWGVEWGVEGTAWLHESWLDTDYFAAWCLAAVCIPTDHQTAAMPASHAKNPAEISQRPLFPKNDLARGPLVACNDPSRCLGRTCPTKSFDSLPGSVRGADLTPSAVQDDRLAPFRALGKHTDGPHWRPTKHRLQHLKINCQRLRKALTPPRWRLLPKNHRSRMRLTQHLQRSA